MPKPQQNQISMWAAHSASRIKLMHETLDEVYGTGFSADNPAIVAQFMSAESMGDIAAGLANIGEILGTGTGAITVGIDRPS